MNNFFSLKFWLNTRPDQLIPQYQRYFIIFVVISAVSTIVFAFIQARNKKNLYGRFWTSLYYFCLTNTIIGVFLLFFTYEAVPFLSARFWFLLWTAEILVWIFFLAKKLRDIPKRKKQLDEEKQYKKYIP